MKMGKTFLKPPTIGSNPKSIEVEKKEFAVREKSKVLIQFE